jgi:hypothetical protein
VEATLGRGQSNQRALSTTNVACVLFAINAATTQCIQGDLFKAESIKSGALLSPSTAISPLRCWTRNRNGVNGPNRAILLSDLSQLDDSNIKLTII